MMANTNQGRNGDDHDGGEDYDNEAFDQGGYGG